MTIETILESQGGSLISVQSIKSVCTYILAEDVPLLAIVTVIVPDSNYWCAK